MQSDKRYLSWCLRQSKGIKLVRPSENLVRAYVEKSRNALRAMEVNAKAGIVEWAVSAGYYAKYFSVYALLSEIGVKCEIHDCTIALFNYLFSDSVSPGIIRELYQSKEDRIEMQYFVREVKVDLYRLIAETRDFVFEMEKLMDGLNSERVGLLRNKLKNLMPASRISKSKFGTHPDLTPFKPEDEAWSHEL